MTHRLLYNCNSWPGCVQCLKNPPATTSKAHKFTRILQNLKRKNNFLVFLVKQKGPYHTNCLSNYNSQGQEWTLTQGLNTIKYIMCCGIGSSWAQDVSKRLSDLWGTDLVADIKAIKVFCTSQSLRWGVQSFSTKVYIILIISLSRTGGKQLNSHTKQLDVPTHQPRCQRHQTAGKHVYVEDLAHFSPVCPLYLVCAQGERQRWDSRQPGNSWFTLSLSVWILRWWLCTSSSQWITAS